MTRLKKKKRALVLALALILCLSGCMAYEDDASPTAAYDGTWYFAVNGAECKFIDGCIYRYDKNELDGQSLTGIYSPAGDHIDANVAYISTLDQTKTLYIVSGENGDFLCDDPDGSGTVYFYREATAYLATLGALESPPPETATPSPAPEEPGNILTIESLELEPGEDAPLPEDRALPSEPAAESTSQTGHDGMVWIPQSGKKYHADPSCSGMKSPRQVTLSEAKSKGYTACKRCY